MTDPVLAVEGLTIRTARAFGASRDIVADIAFTIRRGETLAVVGESGSGKSSTALALLGLLPPALCIERGEIRLLGRRVTQLDDKGWQDIRGRQASMIFQDPLSAFNPVRTIGAQIIESIRRHTRQHSAGARAQAEQCLQSVGVPSPQERLDAYPHELSGGLRQRAMIALALANDPALLVADEPTTALDATMQRQILRLLRQGRERRATLLITHDLALASTLADRVAVMYGGRFVEVGPTQAVLHHPYHPYTAALVALVPDLRSRELRVPIPGSPPRPTERIAGCAFRPRCAQMSERCVQPPPPALAEDDCSHGYECWHPLNGREVPID
jgi:oligopeptide/dipeptide ABC transporter ATP-binding protein